MIFGNLIKLLHLTIPIIELIFIFVSSLNLMLTEAMALALLRKIVSNCKYCYYIYIFRNSLVAIPVILSAEDYNANIQVLKLNLVATVLDPYFPFLTNILYPT